MIKVRKVVVGVSAFVGSLFGQLITKPRKEESFLDKHYTSPLDLYKSPLDTYVNPLQKEVKDMITYPIKVVGVTFEGRQEVIAGLSGKEKVYLVFDDANKFSKYAVQVFIGGKEVGHLPDRMGEFKTSIAHMIRDKVRRGKKIEILSWKRTRGMFEDSNYGITLIIRNEK